jgi:hypothetical protein
MRDSSIIMATLGNMVEEIGMEEVLTLLSQVKETDEELAALDGRDIAEWRSEKTAEELEFWTKELRNLLSRTRPAATS